MLFNMTVLSIFIWFKNFNVTQENVEKYTLKAPFRDLERINDTKIIHGGRLVRFSELWVTRNPIKVIIENLNLYIGIHQ